MERQPIDPHIQGVQLRLSEPPQPRVETVLGVPAAHTDLALQADTFKELINKLSWAIGSTYVRPYSNRHHLSRTEALRLARELFKLHGYPRGIALPQYKVK